MRNMENGEAGMRNYEPLYHEIPLFSTVCGGKTKFFLRSEERQEKTYFKSAKNVGIFTTFCNFFSLSYGLFKGFVL